MPELNQEGLAQAHIKIAVLETMVEDRGREIGELKVLVEKMATKLDALSTAVNSINSTLSEARGGWKMLMLVGGASAALGGAITAFAQHWRP